MVKSSFLSQGQVGGFFIQSRIIALRQAADEMIRMGCPGGLHDIFFPGIFPPVSNIIPNGSIEQPAVLQDHSEQTAQILPVKFTYRGPVD